VIDYWMIFSQRQTVICMTSRYRKEFNASFDPQQTFKAASIWLAGSDKSGYWSYRGSDLILARPER
jgi:hypothetical protein